MGSETIVGPDKAYCRKYLNDIHKCLYFDFDEFIEKLNEMVIIKFDFNTWENSSCTCERGLKYYKCNHVISLAA